MAAEGDAWLVTTSAVSKMVGKPKRGEALTAHIHAVVSKGIPISRLLSLAHMLGFTAEEMAGRCAISRSAFRRWIKKPGYRMTVASSDLLVRHATLLDQAIDALDDSDDARRWLRIPQIGLGGISPLEMAATTHGFREVEKLLTRIDYGVYA